MAEPPPFRPRLVELRRSVLAQLAEDDVLDGGLLSLVAHTSAVLAALDAETVKTAAPALGDRVLVVDDNVTV